jgi:hypothetical protein
MAERTAGHKVDPDGGERLRFSDAEVVVRASADTTGGAFTIIEERTGRIFEDRSADRA